jgi:hypothetical protein
MGEAEMHWGKRSAVAPLALAYLFSFGGPTMADMNNGSVAVEDLTWPGRGPIMIE